MTSSVLSLGLLTAVSAPFSTPSRTATVRTWPCNSTAARRPPPKSAATAHATGVTESAGPYPITTSLEATIGTDCTATSGPGMPFAGTTAPPATVTTRPNLGGGTGLDQIVLDHGSWPANGDQIVLNNYPDDCLGKSIVFSSLPGKPSFTVVGFANSLTGTSTGWTTADGFARLRPPERRPTRRCSTASHRPGPTPTSPPTAKPSGRRARRLDQGSQSYLTAENRRPATPRRSCRS